MSTFLTEDKLLSVHGVAAYVTTWDRQGRFVDDEGVEFQDTDDREAVVSILFPGVVSWAYVLESPPFDAMVVMLADEWHTTSIDLVESREPPSLRPVCELEVGETTTAAVLVFKTQVII